MYLNYYLLLLLFFSTFSCSQQNHKYTGFGKFLPQKQQEGYKIEIVAQGFVVIEKENRIG